MSIRDLAQHLNISIGTVSRALNGRHDVNAETRKRVLAAAAELGYSPNQSGRSLRQGSTGMVALIVPINRHRSLADTIFVTVLEGVRERLADHGRDLLILLCGQDEDPYAYLRRVVARRVADGIIIADTQRKDPRIDYLVDKNIPFVSFGRSRSGGAHPWVDLDFESVAEIGVQRLLGLGHQRIALATTASEINYGYVFAEAYRKALRRHRQSVDESLILRVADSEAGGYDLGERLLAMPTRPTAIMLVNEPMVVGLYRRLAEAGLTPGRDLAIIGFLDEPQGRFLLPKVTCFRSELRALGWRLSEALLARMRPNETGKTKAIQELWPMQLVPGDSDAGPV